MMIFFTEEHEWIREESGKFQIGITDYAQTELGDVVFIDLPEVGTELSKGESILTVESVKAVSDVYMPVDGKIIAVNETLNDSPELVNESPLSQGWFVLVEVNNKDDLSTLMTQEAYDSFVGGVSK